MNMHTKKQLEAFYQERVWEPLTLGAALEKWSIDYKDAIAVVDGDSAMTYDTLNREAEKLACGFLSKGYRQGDRIVLQLPSSLEFIKISFALFKIGVVPVMALPAHRNSEIAGILQSSHARGYVIVDAYLGFDYRKMAREILEALEYKPSVIVLGDSEEFESITDYVATATYPIDAAIDYKDVGLLMLSGGTTGIPKLIPRRHTDYLFVAKKSGERCGLNRKSVYLVSLPAAHNFPFGSPGIIGTLYYGGKVVICPTTSPDEILSLMDDENVTITGMVPAVASMCAEFLDMDDEYDISSLKVLQVGGSVLDASLAKKIAESFCCKLQQIFGTAEGLVCCTALDDSDEVIYNTQGKPISEYDELRIVDENNAEVPNDSFGELIVRGPYTIYGYEAADDINAQCFTEDCYYRTGDKARRRSDGNYQIVGRLKEMINRVGEKIMPSEIEELLVQHPMIKEVQAVGIPDSFLGERICVFILKGLSPLSLADVRQYLIEKAIAAYKLPDDVVYVDAWPLTSVGKIDKTALRNMRGEDDIR